MTAPLIQRYPTEYELARAKARHAARIAGLTALVLLMGVAGWAWAVVLGSGT